MRFNDTSRWPRLGRDRHDAGRVVRGEVIDPTDVDRADLHGPDTDGADVVDLSAVRARTPDGTADTTAPDMGADVRPDADPGARPDTDDEADTNADEPGTLVLSGRDTSTALSGVPAWAPASGAQIVPSWLRSREAFTGAASEWLGYVGRWSAFHALRVPSYWARLTLRSRRTLWRMVVFTFNWTTDVNGRIVRRSVAYMPSLGANEAHAFHRVSEQHRERVRFRLLFLAVLAAVLVPAAVVLGQRVPGWQLAAAAGVVLPLLGLFDRDPARRPVLDSFAAADTHAPRVTTQLVEAALAALGIAELNKAFRPGGDGVRFVAPGVHRDGPGWRVDVDLAGGVTAGDVAERRDRLASGLRRPLSCVWPETDHDAHPGRLVLWVGDKPAHQSKPKPWPLTDRGRISLFDPFPVGVDQRGRPVTLTLMFASMLIGAVPRMGKSFSLRLILLAAALDHLAELHVFDLKGGVDHRPLAMVAHRYRSGDDEEDLAYVRDDLRDLKTEMTRRYKVLRGLPETVCPEGKVTPQLAADRTLGLHPIVVALDECQVLFEHPTFGADAVEVCTDLVKRGPAVGITMVLATQRPDAKSIPTPISTSAVLRFCLKVMSQTSNDMVLGTSMYKAGVRATMFAFSDKGTGYLLGEGSDPQIVRTAYLDAVTAKTIAARARSYRVAAGTLTGHAAGLDTIPTSEDAATVLDDLAHVMPAGEAKVWSDVLIERLAEYKPDVYTGWTAVDLGQALVPYGVETVQIGRRVDGKVVNRKGLDRAALTAALDRLTTTREHTRGTPWATEADDSTTADAAAPVDTERDEPAGGARTAPAPRRALDDLSPTATAGTREAVGEAGDDAEGSR